MRIVLSQNRLTGELDPVLVDGIVVEGTVVQMETTAFGTNRITLTLPDTKES